MMTTVLRSACNPGTSSSSFSTGAQKKRTDAFVFDDDTGLLEWLAADRAVVTFKDQADIRAKKTKLIDLVKCWMKATS